MTNSVVSELFIMKDNAEEYKYFRRFFNIYIMDVIVNETNKCYEY